MYGWGNTLEGGGWIEVFKVRFCLVIVISCFFYRGRNCGRRRGLG